MGHCKKIICLLLLACILLEPFSMPVRAAETTSPLQTEPAPTEPTVTTELSAATTAPTEETCPTESAEAVETTEATEPATEPEIEEDSSVKYSQSASMRFDTEGFMGALEEVPLYLQTDYPNTPYSDGSVATSGCTMACVAMVASYLTGEEVLPDDLAKRYNNYEASNIQRMEAASTVLDLKYTKTTDWDDVMDALAKGKVVTILVGKPSKFTGTQHTLVLTGLTSDGKIMVNDPNGRNYKKKELKEGFRTGFSPKMVSTGFGGAWIYDDYTPPAQVESRYPEMKLTADEKYMIASTIWLEARGESFEGQQAIAEVIFNRMASGQFSKTVQGTIMAEGQFRTARFLDKAKPGELQYKAIEKAISGPNVLPMDVYYFARTKTNNNVWGSIDHHVFCYAPS